MRTAPEQSGNHSCHKCVQERCAASPAGDSHSSQLVHNFTGDRDRERIGSLMHITLPPTSGDCHTERWRSRSSIVLSVPRKRDRPNKHRSACNRQLPHRQKGQTLLEMGPPRHSDVPLLMDCPHPFSGRLLHPNFSKATSSRPTSGRGAASW